jgi:hypothetical protein
MLAGMPAPDDGEKDWRLQAELGPNEARERLRELVGRLRGQDVVDDVKGSVGDDVVITHDGGTLYGYAATEAAIRAAREVVEAALARDGVQAEIRLSHWDGEREQWRQVDPPLNELAREALEREQRVNDELETRTLVASAGRLVRGDFEQSMAGWAERLGLRCEIVEHPHLLTTQVAFTVTGPKERVDEFAAGLRAEGWTYVRTETGVMLNPL